ncbi:MAG: hypothetical protein DBY35_04390 [Bacteroidales bacterium]|nr:MAG: hypothetical protein DBY35_04390 [Bacteroidales bacterium]
MKKIFNLFVIALICCLASCKEDVDLVDPGTPTNPEKAIEGVYSGVMTRTVRTTGVSESANAVLTIAPTEDRYVANITISCPDFDINLSSVANVLPSQGDYSYFNNLSGNTLGALFTGTVSQDVKDASLGYSLTVREGRKTTTYDFLFEGTK